MTKKTPTPVEVIEALTMREAGYTVLSISQATGISPRALNRHFAAHATAKGALKKDAIEAARARLLDRITSDDAIREEAARLVNDDLAHARHLRTIMINASEHLQATNLEEAALVMRAAAAYGTAIKTTSDTIRQTLRLERVLDQSGTELPVLTILELSQEDIIEMRRKEQAPEEAPTMTH